jgi:DinB superfamily
MTATSTTAIIDALERAPAIVIPLVRQAPPVIVKRRPPSGKWSIHEHACHLADVHALFSQRLDVMLSTDCPNLESYDPGRDDPDERLLHIDLETALGRFEADRAVLVGRVRRLTSEQWQRPARHDEYNSYSVFTMFRHLALHDLFHAYRIEELLLRRDWPSPQLDLA